MEMKASLKKQVAQRKLILKASECSDLKEAQTQSGMINRKKKTAIEKMTQQE